MQKLKGVGVGVGVSHVSMLLSSWVTAVNMMYEHSAEPFVVFVTENSDWKLEMLSSQSTNPRQLKAGCLRS